MAGTARWDFDWRDDKLEIFDIEDVPTELLWD